MLAPALRLMILVSCILLQPACYAADFDLQSAQKLFKQMQDVFNTKDGKLVGKFLDYYVTSDAVFQKKSMLIRPGDLEGHNSVEDKTYNKEGYIEYIKQIINIGANYSFEAEVESFQLLPNNYLAYVLLKIKERSIVYNKDSTTPLNNIVSTNCNYTLISDSDGPKIAAANCFEKIVLEK